MENNEPALTPQTPVSNGNGVRKYLVPAAIILLALIAVVSWLVLKNSTSLLGSRTGSVLSGKLDIQPVPEKSFGDLQTALLAATNQGGGMAGSSETTKMGSPAIAMDQSAKGMGIGGGGGVAIPYPGPQRFVFKYTGGSLPPLGELQDVFKRKLPAQSTDLWSRIVQSATFGLFDLSKMQGGRLSSLNAIEDRDFGYGTTVDFENGSAGLYMNWNRWPQNQNTQIKESDIPSDTETIQIAQQFLDQYNVSRDGYGMPSVDKSWIMPYEKATENKMAYLPQMLTVVYPLLIDGKEVLYEYGGKVGIRVDVDIRQKKVTGAYEIMTRQFERSLYPGERDASRIIKLAEKGGFRNYSYDEPGAKEVVLELDTPEMKITRMWYSPGNDQMSTELYVPMLVFPIKNWNKAGYWRETIVVPVVKQLLDYDDANRPIPVDSVPVEPVPMPREVQSN